MKKFRILSIDGGGMLGLYSAQILEYIKDEFLESQEYSSYFQLITGTSTGGIIALGLSAGISISEIKDFYIKSGKTIFPKRAKWLNLILSLFKYKYSHSALEEVLTKLFQEKKMKDAKCCVCIPSIAVDNCQPIVFKANTAPHLTRDQEIRMKDVALATSSAPTFFPIYSFGNYSGLVDGGLWHNNPSLIGLIEANAYFVGDNKEYNEIELLSIGNPHSNLKNTLSVKTNTSSLLKWKSSLVELPMKVSSKANDQILNFLSKSKSLNLSRYLRIASENITRKQEGLYLDLASDDAMKTLTDLAYSDYYRIKTDLHNFFGKPIAE